MQKYYLLINIRMENLRPLISSNSILDKEFADPLKNLKGSNSTTTQNGIIQAENNNAYQNIYLQIFKYPEKNVTV